MYVVGNQILVIADEDGVGHIRSFAIGMAEDGEFSPETLLSSPYMSFYDGSTRDDMTFTIAWTESAMTYCDELYGITR